MAEPVFLYKLNEGTEGAPTWTTLVTAMRWTGPAGIGDPFAAPVLDATDAFFDNTASPNDGEFWHDKGGADVQIDEAGRSLNQNTLQMDENGDADGTADPPEFTAYDDATDAGNRTNPTISILTGTAGSSSISYMRAIETTGAAPGAAWGTQTHDAAPGVGNQLDGDKTGEKVTMAAVHAASATKTLQLAACAAHDAPAGLTTFVYSYQYTYT